MNCTFCDPTILYKNVVLESENFLVRIGVAITGPGHLLVVSKMHFDSFANIPDNLDQEFFQIEREAINLVRNKVHEPFIVEYGNCGSIYHAHQHIIPLKNEGYFIEDLYKEILEKSGVNFEVLSWTEIKKRKKIDDSYVKFAVDNQMYYAKLDKDDPTYNNIGYRYFLSQRGVKGISGWQNMTEEDKIIDKAKLKKSREMFGVK